MTANTAFTVTHRDEPVVIQLTGPHVPEQSFQQRLFDLIDQQSIKHLVVDFSQVTHCTSSIIGALIQVKRQHEPGGGTLKLCCLSQPMRDKFKKLKLEPLVFAISGTVDEALVAVAQTPLPATNDNVPANPSSRQ